MVRIITVERLYGSLGATYAHKLADRLGWKLLDDCLIEEIALKAGVDKSQVERCDERLDPWFHRFEKAIWHGALEGLPIPSTNTFDSERMVSLVREALEERAREGNCVVVGRGAACLLRSTPGAFHVFVHASMARRVKWFADEFPEHSASAEAAVLAADRRRAAYIRRYHDVDWTDYRLYHLALNSCMGYEAMLDATTAAAGLAALVPANEKAG